MVRTLLASCAAEAIAAAKDKPQPFSGKSTTQMRDSALQPNNARANPPPCSRAENIAARARKSAGSMPPSPATALPSVSGRLRQTVHEIKGTVRIQMRACDAGRERKRRGSTGLQSSRIGSARASGLLIDASGARDHTGAGFAGASGALGRSLPRSDLLRVRLLFVRGRTSLPL